MTEELKNKIAELLNLDTPSNYVCWEDAEESIVDELSDEDRDSYFESCSSMIEEWFCANEETESDEESETETED
jgi:hypothetical protein